MYPPQPRKTNEAVFVSTYVCGYPCISTSIGFAASSALVAAVMPRERPRTVDPDSGSHTSNVDRPWPAMHWATPRTTMLDAISLLSLLGVGRGRGMSSVVCSAVGT